MEILELINIVYIIGLGMGSIFAVFIMLIVIELQEKRKRKALMLFNDDFIIQYNKFNYMVLEDWDMTKKLVLIKTGVKHETIGQSKKSKA